MFKRKTNHKQLVLMLALCFSSVLAFAQAKSYSFSLEEAKSYAIKNGYASQTAQLEVEKSNKKVNETIGSGLPQINASGNYQRYLDVPLSLIPNFFGNDPEFIEVFFGTEQQMGANIRAEQLIFDGSYFVGLQAARVYLELSKNDLAKSDIEISSLVTEAYGNVLVAEQNVKILKGNVENLEKNAFEVEEFYKNGFVEEQDRDQIALSLATVKNAYENAMRMTGIARNQLKFLLGIDIASTVELSDDLKTITTNSTSEEYLNKEFDVQSHIDYQIINTQERATELLLKQQKSTVLPRLSAFYNLQTTAFSNEFDFVGNRFYSGQLVGLNLNVPIFSGFGRSNRIQQAKIDYQKVNIAKKQVEQQLSIQAQNAKSQYTFALSQYRTSEDNMALAQRIYNKTKIKYDEGISTSLDLTQANNQLLETQGNYIDAAFQLINAKSNLDKALNQN